MATVSSAPAAAVQARRRRMPIEVVALPALARDRFMVILLAWFF
jgi:hypothetical protein